MSVRGLKFVSPIEESGYGNAARAYLRGLLRAGVPVTWQPLRWGRDRYVASDLPSGDPVLDATIGRRVEYDHVLVHFLPEYYEEWRAREPGKRLTGYTTWETSELKPEWLPMLAKVDQLLVPSHWNAEVFRRSGVGVPIHVIPHIHETPRAAAPTPSGIPKVGFVFYTIGPWTRRKQPWLALDAYWRSFTRSDDVLFVLKTSRLSGNQGRRSLLRRWTGGRWFTVRRLVEMRSRSHRSPAPVLVLEEELPETAIHGLHDRGDCYVSMCASEGWGLGAFDAAARGKPVVMTGYGGQLDFLSPDAAYLVDYRLEDAVLTGGSEMRGSWAVPDVPHAAKLMRHVYDHRDEARERGARLADRILADFTEASVIPQLLEVIAACPAPRG